MKAPTLSLLLTSALLLSCTAFGAEPLAIDQPGNKRRVAFASEGEDASSAFYTFFYNLPGENVSKIRMLWNGGAGNQPTITDYYLEAPISGSLSGLPSVVICHR